MWVGSVGVCVCGYVCHAARCSSTHLVDAQLQRDVGVNDVDVDSRERLGRQRRRGRVGKDDVVDVRGVREYGRRRGGRRHRVGERRGDCRASDVKWTLSGAQTRPHPPHP